MIEQADKPHQPPRAFWARAEVRFILLCVVVAALGLAFGHFINLRGAGNGAPIGAMPPAPSAVNGGVNR